MGIEWGLEELRNKKYWLEGKKNEYNRLNAAYEAIQELKDVYNKKVESARKEIFKDGCFSGSYNWKGSNYQWFVAMGKESGEVWSAVDSYDHNGINGLDDVADALLVAKRAVWDEIEDTFMPKFGWFEKIDDLFEKISREIACLLN